MKYNFVYDTEVLESMSNILSEDEIKIVLATVIGKHNAIFYGYKPERLIKAIKRLSNETMFVEQNTFSDIEDGLCNSIDGIMYLKDFDVWKVAEQQFLYGHTLNDSSRTTQFIANVSITPSACVIPDVLNNFDIVYKCTNSLQTPMSNETIKQKLNAGIWFRRKLRSGQYTTSTELRVERFWMDSDVYSNVERLSEENNPVYAKKIALVARSLSDIEQSTYTEMKQLHEAETFYEE